MVWGGAPPQTTYDSLSGIANSAFDLTKNAVPYDSFSGFANSAFDLTKNTLGELTGDSVSVTDMIRQSSGLARVETIAMSIFEGMLLFEDVFAVAVKIVVAGLLLYYVHWRPAALFWLFANVVGSLRLVYFVLKVVFWTLKLFAWDSVGVFSFISDHLGPSIIFYITGPRRVSAIAMSKVGRGPHGRCPSSVYFV